MGGSSQLSKQPVNKIPGVGDDWAQDGTWWSLIGQPGDKMLESPFVNETCIKVCYLDNKKGTDELRVCLGRCEQTKMDYKSCNLYFKDDVKKRKECLQYAKETGSLYINTTRCVDDCNLDNKEGSNELEDCLSRCKQIKMAYDSCKLHFTDDVEKRLECLQGAKSCNLYYKDDDEKREECLQGAMDPGSLFMNTAWCIVDCNLGNKEGSKELKDCLSRCEQTKMAYESCNLHFTDDVEKRVGCRGPIDSYKKCQENYKCNEFREHEPGCYMDYVFRSTYWKMFTEEMDICDEVDPTVECYNRALEQSIRAGGIDYCWWTFCDDYCKFVLERDMNKIMKSG